jgi:iron complex outermembrane receptor protein/outer membrane receptor for ferrienterochelin and colicins
MMKRLLIFFFLFPLAGSYAQAVFKGIVKDSLTKEALPGVTIVVGNSTRGTVSDVNGAFSIGNISSGKQVFIFYLTGYKKKTIELELPLTAEPVILLAPDQQELEEVVVSSTRTNSRIDDLPTKVEVLGQEDMDEESTLVPGNVSSILGDLSIITIQRTNALNGNESIRMQGLDAKYTQIMRDGLPLYGGFSGSLGVLSIPPLDLKQVEIIKGSASTLYGGGAIGGLINFISKTPVEEREGVFTLNGTSLGEGNANAFFSGKKGSRGMTLFAGANVKQAVDINGDGFTDVPRDENYSIHPRFFAELNKKTQLVAGISSSYDKRAAGDIVAVREGAGNKHPYLQQETSLRNSAHLSIASQLSEKNSLTFKTAGSQFQRNLNYHGFIFDGTQYSSYSELNDLLKLEKHTLVGGLNFISEKFMLGQNDAPAFSGYNYFTGGVFLQDDWQILKKVSIQAGARYDHHNVYGSFFLPRLSLFVKTGSRLSIRMAAGSGYKTPNMFDLAEPSPLLGAIPSGTKAEHSYGLNADINYHTVIAEKFRVEFNEAFYYTAITDPLIPAPDSSGRLTAMNAYAVNSYGTDTYLRLGYDDLELYLGYNHTESLLQGDSVSLNMPFNPKDKFSLTLAWEVEGEWRLGAEAAYTGNQYVYNNRKVPDFLFMAAMVERKFENCSLVLNCENLLDVRQSRFEPLVSGSRQSPVFNPLWGPVEGRVINLSLKIKI